MLKQNDQHFAQFDRVSVGYQNRLVFEGLDLSLAHGKITAFCGPNGCGKSTALKTLRRHLHPTSGNISVLSAPIAQLQDKQLAKQMAMLSQSPSAPEEMSVFQLVSLGRFASRKSFAGLSTDDNQKIKCAIDACDLAGLEERSIGELSGGQLQRSWIAMVLAQDAPAILLDEPTNHLDITHQLETMDLIQSLNQRDQKTIVLVSHDINLAARYAHEMVLFKNGNVVAQGAPEAVMNAKTLDDVFEIKSQIVTDPIFKKPFCFAYPKHAG
jgi:iron complex transport system ATP-binding protein